MDERLRVLFLVPDLRRGGAERYVTDVVAALNRRDDVEAVIGTLGPGDQFHEVTSTLRVVCLHAEPHSFRRPKRCTGYDELLRTFRPHVVHTNLFMAESLSAQSVSRTVAYVCSGHDNMVPFRRFVDGASLIQRLQWRYEVGRLRVLKYARVRTHFIANSKDTLAFYREVLPRRMRRDVILLHCGFDYSRFYRELPPARDPNQPLQLVNVASFQPKKNQQFLLEVARCLKERGSKFQLALLGDGALRPAVQTAAATLGLEDCVSLPGVVGDVQSWYGRSDVYVHAATYEPFGLVFLEAMAAGLPIVTLDGRGNRDIVEDGVNGFLLHTPDARSFAARIEEIASKPELARAMALAGQRRAAAFDIDVHAETLVAFYRRIRREVPRS